MVAAPGSGPGGRKTVWVRLPPSVLGVYGGMVPEAGCKPVVTDRPSSILGHPTLLEDVVSIGAGPWVLTR